MRTWRFKELGYITQRHTADAQVSAEESRTNTETYAPDAELVGNRVWKKLVLTDGNVRKWGFFLNLVFK